MDQIISAGVISGFRLMTHVAANLFQRPARVKKTAQTPITGSAIRKDIQYTENLTKFKIFMCLLSYI